MRELDYAWRGHRDLGISRASVVLTFVVSFVTAVVGIGVWWTGWQNLQIAQVKLHWDLYERRYKVFKAVETLLQNALNKGELTIHEDYVPYWLAVADAPFIFHDPRLTGFLRTVDKQVITLEATVKRLQGSPGDPDLSERQLQQQIAITEFLTKLADRFEPFLAEPRIRTVPVWLERFGRWTYDRYGKGRGRPS